MTQRWSRRSKNKLKRHACDCVFLHHMLFCSYYRIGLGVVQMVQTKGDLWGSQKKSCCWNGYKTISKVFGLHKSTVRQIVYNWRKFKITVALPRSGQPTKITPKARCVIVCEAAMDPRVTSNQLKAILTLPNVNIHESTIRKRLSNHRVNGKVARRKPLLSKNNIAACLQFAKDHLDKTRGLLDKLCVDGWDQNIIFGLNEKCYVCRKGHCIAA